MTKKKIIICGITGNNFPYLIQKVIEEQSKGIVITQKAEENKFIIPTSLNPIQFKPKNKKPSILLNKSIINIKHHNVKVSNNFKRFNKGKRK